MNQVVFDSRIVSRGDLFYALDGARVRGEAYLEEAARRGAVGAVVRRGYEGPDFGLALERVDDVLACLQARARERLERWGVTVVGITGSVGKTSTKEFLGTLLGERFHVGRPEGSCNSQVSLPATVLNFSGDEEVLVLELGMSYPGEMARLVDIAQPHFGLLTNVSLSHAGNFDGLEAIAREKMTLFQSKRLKRGFVSEQCPECDCVRYGFGAGVDVRAEVEGNRVRIGAVWIELPFSARHLILNFVGAVCVAREMGLSWEEIGRGAAKLEIAPHRGIRKEIDGVTYIDDSYNASSASSRAALECLPEGRRVLVFGQMGELGKFSEQAHREVGEKAAQVCDVAILLGEGCKPIEEQMKKAGKPVWRFAEKADLRRQMDAVIQKGDVVLVKGANSHKLWEVLP